jgi:hypothetical protein
MSAYRDYIRRVEATAASLQTDSRLRTIFELNRPFTPEEFTDLEESMSRALREEVSVWSGFRELYGVANGFLFQWLYSGDRDVTTKAGSASIAMVQEIYLPENLPAGREKLFYGQKRVLDRISPDDQVAVCFRQGTAEPELHYFSDDTGDYHQLDLDVPLYLETMLEARAMYRWQQFFVTDREFPLSKKAAESFRRSLSNLFPDADVSRFLARSER